MRGLMFPGVWVDQDHPASRASWNGGLLGKGKCGTFCSLSWGKCDWQKQHAITSPLPELGRPNGPASFRSLEHISCKRFEIIHVFNLLQCCEIYNSEGDAPNFYISNTTLSILIFSLPEGGRKMEMKDRAKFYGLEVQGVWKPGSKGWRKDKDKVVTLEVNSWGGGRATILEEWSPRKWEVRWEWGVGSSTYR